MHKAFSYSVDISCKRFLETYFVSLNPLTRLPREVVDLTDVQQKEVAYVSHKSTRVTYIAITMVLVVILRK